MNPKALWSYRTPILRKGKQERGKGKGTERAALYRRYRSCWLMSFLPPSVAY